MQIIARHNPLIATIYVAFYVALLALSGGCDSHSPSTEAAPESGAGANDQPEDDNSPEETPALYRQLMVDTLIDADYWQEEPAILAAGLGFLDLNGVPELADPGLSLSEIEAQVRAVGGGWHEITSTIPADSIDLRARTAAGSLVGITESFGYPSVLGDGLPIEFSHPVLASTVQREDIVVGLNTGELVTPTNISVMPNMEYNERSTLVINGDFGNRLNPTDAEAVYPVHFEVVDELLLVTPAGTFNAQGLAFGDGAEPLTAYTPGKGPRLCAAKLTQADAGLAGEGGPAPFQSDRFPNDLRSLYGEAADYRLRIMTTGGFSVDGVRSIYPTEFAQHFRVGVAPTAVARDDTDALIWLTEVGKTYDIPGYGQLTVLGLADLGVAQSNYDDSYIEDHDNQIDIVIAGDRAAAERIASVHIPAAAPYLPLYNPGGPGTTPDPNTRYSEPSPEWFQPVTVALDNPMQVSYTPE